MPEGCELARRAGTDGVATTTTVVRFQWKCVFLSAKNVDSFSDYSRPRTNVNSRWSSDFSFGLFVRGSFSSVSVRCSLSVLLLFLLAHFSRRAITGPAVFRWYLVPRQFLYIVCLRACGNWALCSVLQRILQWATSVLFIMSLLRPGRPILHASQTVLPGTPASSLRRFSRSVTGPC